MPRKLAAGNWKMNGCSPDLTEARRLREACPDPSAGVLICPPATLLSRLSDLLQDSPIATGGQDCHANGNGAHTGDIAAGMLADAGAAFVILGHSERRTDHAESNDTVRAKAEAAIAAGLTTIICVGETKAEREAGDTLKVIAAQLAGSLPDGVTAENTVIAYEPVWAIGTGLVPTIDEIDETHEFIRTHLDARFESDTGEEISLLYGGSVKGSNAAEIFAVEDVNGALVGGASLKCDDFLPIIRALEAS
ncbi:triose-phosphate isomerase [Alterinioella nitratireducens]|uniref:triose-phosphate isomerase n=1 Tax=Alterinioella nitratireducens TaxID=2735915 RepID=UPI004057FCC4